MAEADKKTLRVLIAEDNKHDYHLVKRALEKSKYPFNLTWVQTKKDLLESLETSSFDTLILDMNLPDASGLEVLEEINEQGINIPVVFNTGSSTLNMAVEAMHLGASEFLVKDVEGEYVKIIPEVIQKAINQWEDQQARIQAEQALKSSEEKYRQIVEEATDTVYTINLEGFFTYINQRVKLFTGYSSEELIGKHYSMLVRPDFTDAIQSFYSKKFEEASEDLRKEFPIMTKDGKEKWVEQIGSLISEGDEIVGLQFIVRDISARKNAEEALLTSEQRYRALFELNQDAVYLLDTEGHYLAVNQNGAEILGYSPEELIGRSMEINIPPDELGNSRLQLETLLAGETLPIYQRTFMRRDGTEFPVEVTIALVRDSDGEPLHIQSIVRDISERVAADKSIQSNLNRTQGLYQISRSTTSFNNIPDLIHSIADNVADALSAEQVLIITMDHIKEEVVHYGIGGPKAADLEKDTYDQLMDGLTGWVIENQEPALSPHGVDDKRESIDNQKRRKKSGGPALLVLPLTYRGRSLGTITAIRHPENQDFSQEDLKLVETVSDHLSTTIQNVILFDKIQANSERLQEVDRLKSQFLANMSHEIRTPLNAIIGMTDLVFETKLDETQQEYLEIIQSSGDLLLSTINDIIDFSQIEAGKLVIEDTQMSLEEEIDKTINMLSFKAAEKDLELGFSISSNVPKQIVSDPHRLRQILVNLVGNSIKFTESGSISVEVDSVILENEILEIKFAVRDTGVGIPEDRKDILFEPFKQVDSSIRRRHGGSGLGLAISKQLCELMQGRIWVDSQEGEGSTFFFTILCNPADPENEMLGNLTTDDFPSLGDKRPLEILLAEDSIVNQKVAMYSLQRLGYQVDVVDNGHQVLEALKKKAYDVIMMDIQMPGMDGIEATRHIRKNLPPNQQPRIIALTAHAMSEDRERCLEAGMDDYVEKPFKIERLVQALGASKIVEV